MVKSPRNQEDFFPGPRPLVTVSTPHVGHCATELTEMAGMNGPHKPATTPLIAGTVATTYDDSHDVTPIGRGRRAVVVDGQSRKSGIVVKAASLMGLSLIHI